MSSVGVLKNGKFEKVAGNFDVLDAPLCTESIAGFMSPIDKIKLEESYTKSDVAPIDVILELFND